jgi:hypothetical protein
VTRSPKRTWFGYGAAASLAAVVATSAIGAAQWGCTTQPILEPLRSLERSGAISYVCLDTPLSARGIAKPLTDCTGFAAPDQQTFAEDDAGAIIGPHLYAMVTQTSRGEVAVVDMTSQVNPVLDEDPNIPGANFLPIGAEPVDIVSSQGSTATFVGVAETGREGIFALPSTIIRPSDLLDDGGVSPETPRPVPTLSSWPACALPSAPGAMLLIDDPPNASGAERARCDEKFGQLPPAGDNGDLGLEGFGRPKLVVAMPDMGGIVVIDAQTLLDRAPGSFDACPVDRWVPLKVKDQLPTTLNPPPNPPGQACVWPENQGPAYAKSYTPRPSGMSYVDGVLYVADLQAPVIHVLDMTAGGTQVATPCDPIEKPQSALLPRALTGFDLTRVPVTKKVSVGPLTSTLKRYAYAIDEQDASMMVFDLTGSPGMPPSRYPIDRPHPEWDPLTPRDRVRLPSPVADVLVAQHDAAQPLPTTGVAPEGARCDPNPALSCVTGASKCDIGSVYRTSPTYDLGAGPLKLRGQFAFAALTNGHVGVVDIEDYDAPCRIPAGLPGNALVPLAGCDPPYPSYPLPTPISAGATLISAGEVSCNVVMPNQPRDQVYTAPQQDAGFHQPSIQTVPLLYDLNGTEITGSGAARMIGTLPNPAVSSVLPLGAVSVAGSVLPNCPMGPAPVSCVDDKMTGVSYDEQGAVQNTAFMNLEDPRAQIADQSWVVTFEGQLPGFASHLATVSFKGMPSDGLSDPDARFCDSGVQSQKAVAELLAAYNAQNIDAQSLDLADYVQIFTDLPLETDPFWTRAGESCTFAECNSTFGTTVTPTTFRDLPIVEAYQDHVDLLLETHALVPQPDKNGKPQPAVREPIDPNLLNCCFPPPVAYNVRVGGQWAVIGSATGFLHHVIADPSTGVCRNSCEGALPDGPLQRLNARVYPTPKGATSVTDVNPKDPFADGSIYAFINPMFRFAILGAGARDEVFQFATSGSFQPLLVVLAPDATTLMSPVAVSIVPPLGELLAVVDGGHQGITTVEISSAAVSRHFF